mmetsp:Transcript_52207/g.122142  ORF Transcript_52207/g.122142 Transcript_52207/m.122142 type:complete len:190 (-) Transcript_52207:34-603(-)
MEPIAVFEGDQAVAATWVQSDDSVTLMVPLPSSSSEESLVESNDALGDVKSKPEVVIAAQHITVRWLEACANESEPGATKIRTVPLIDNELSGTVVPEDSTWTWTGGSLLIELVKRPDYAAATGQASKGPTSAELRPPWWPCAVRGGKLGPEDPKAPPKMQPDIHRLDSKIGAQSEKKGTFQGKSRFAW